VLSLPIALFEGTAAPLREAWRRQRGNGARMFVASVTAVMPFAVTHFGLREFAHAWAQLAPSAGWWFWAMGFVLFPAAFRMNDLMLILCMSGVVAAAYLRLSPRMEPVYGVFD
jgi:hypothetical protein